MLIELRKPVPNRWRILDDADPAESGEPVQVGTGDVISLARWRSLRGSLPPTGDARTVGVLLAPHDDPYELQHDLHRVALIAIHFPVFTDGRGYSAARLLRQQLRYTGPLMAIGDVLRDQLLLLERCGFDRFQLREDQDLGEALAAFGDFSDAYQATAARVPLFSRRRASIEVGA